MAPRGVQGYQAGTSADRYQTPNRPVTGSGNIPVGKEQNPASSRMAGMVPDTDAGQSDGFDYSQDPVQAALAAIGSLNFNPTQRYGAGGGAQGPNASDVLAKRQYEDELAKQQRALEAYQQMLSGGSYRGGQDRMLELLRGQAGTSTKGVEGLYGEAMGNIGAGYGDAQRLTDTGYSALQEFLRQNPNNPYANVAVGAGPTQDDLSGLLGAYGVSADPVRAQVAAEGASAQQGAAGFQNLLNVLGASAKQSDASRLAEMMMSQNYANTSLGSQRAGFQSQAARAQQDALAQIQAQLAQGEMQQEQSSEARRQQIEDAIAAAGGELPKPKEEGDEETAPAAKQKPIDALKARMETANPALKKKIEQFVAQNPRAGQAKIEKAFPKIAAKNK
jgi:hypothetical protein